jgi:hypothetical protein
LKVSNWAANLAVEQVRGVGSLNWGSGDAEAGKWKMNE